MTSNNADSRYVLLIDDTWTSRGHALSTTLAIRATGADHVCILVLARWLTLGWEATTQERAKVALSWPDCDPEVCLSDSRRMPLTGTGEGREGDLGRQRLRPRRPVSAIVSLERLRVTRDIAQRDIKPASLLWLGGVLVSHTSKRVSGRTPSRRCQAPP